MEKPGIIQKLEHLNTKKQLSNTKKSDTIDIKNNNKSKKQGKRNSFAIDETECSAGTWTAS